MARMIGKTSYTCPWRCCRDLGHSRKAKTVERRMVKRRERQAWKNFTSTS